MTELSLRLNALEGQGRAETNGSQRAGALFLGCPPVSVGQEAEVGAWLGDIPIETRKLCSSQAVSKHNRLSP